MSPKELAEVVAEARNKQINEDKSWKLDAVAARILDWQNGISLSKPDR
jgi:hypothetical protein